MSTATPDCSHMSERPECSNTPAFTQVYSDRFSRFNLFIKKALERITSEVSEEEYIILFGNLSALKKSKSAPGKLQKKMKTNLMDSLMSEMEIMVKEENIQEKLQTLDKLEEESMLEKGREAWRPNGNVNDHVRSYLMEVKVKHKDNLEQCVGEKEQVVECVKEKVDKLRTQVRSLYSRLLKLQTRSMDSSVIDRIDKKVIEIVQDLN